MTCPPRNFGSPQQRTSVSRPTSRDWYTASELREREGVRRRLRWLVIRAMMAKRMCESRVRQSAMAKLCLEHEVEMDHRRQWHTFEREKRRLVERQAELVAAAECERVVACAVRLVGLRATCRVMNAWRDYTQHKNSLRTHVEYGLTVAAHRTRLRALHRAVTAWRCCCAARIGAEEVREEDSAVMEEYDQAERDLRRQLSSVEAELRECKRRAVLSWAEENHSGRLQRPAIARLLQAVGLTLNTSEWLLFCDELGADAAEGVPPQQVEEYFGDDDWALLYSDVFQLCGPQRIDPLRRSC